MDKDIFGNMRFVVCTEHPERPPQSVDHASVAMDTHSVAALLDDVTDSSATISKGEGTSKEDTASSPTTIGEPIARRAAEDALEREGWSAISSTRLAWPP